MAANDCSLVAGWDISYLVKANGLETLIRNMITNRDIRDVPVT